MSDKIRHFESGAIRDTEEGKLDFIETISWTAFARYAKYMTEKKAKYGSGNFKKGIDVDAYERSLLRHIHKYLVNKYEGGNIENDQDHLSAIIFNTFGIMHEEERMNDEYLKNRPPTKPDSGRDLEYTDSKSSKTNKPKSRSNQK